MHYSRFIFVIFQLDGSTTTPTMGTKKRRKVEESKDVYSDVMLKACTTLENIGKKSAQPSDSDDSHLFGMHVAESLRSISDNRMRSMCQLKIQEVLHNCQYPPPPASALPPPGSGTYMGMLND